MSLSELVGNIWQNAAIMLYFIVCRDLGLFSYFQASPTAQKVNMHCQNFLNFLCFRPFAVSDL